jgi:hypothetical protein
METYKKNKLSWFTIVFAFCLPVLTLNAGILSMLGGLLDPGVIEIPAIVNVFGPQEPDDVNNVKEIFRTANEILEQANVQFTVKRITTGIIQVGDGDGRLTEDEHLEALLGSVFDLERHGRKDENNNDIVVDTVRMRHHHGPSKGVKFNIADDVWVERPEYEFWHDIFYPVTFLESSVPPEQMGRILAREVGISAGLSPSTNPANLMHPNSEGTEINEVQKSRISGLARQVGHLRSPSAKEYVPEVLSGFRRKQHGALFFSEGNAAIHSGDWSYTLIEDVN